VVRGPGDLERLGCISFDTPTYPSKSTNEGADEVPPAVVAKIKGLGRGGSKPTRGGLKNTPEEEAKRQATLKKKKEKLEKVAREAGGEVATTKKLVLKKRKLVATETAPQNCVRTPETAFTPVLPTTATSTTRTELPPVLQSTEISTITAGLALVTPVNTLQVAPQPPKPVGSVVPNQSPPVWDVSSSEDVVNLDDSEAWDTPPPRVVPTGATVNPLLVPRAADQAPIPGLEMGGPPRVRGRNTLNSSGSEAPPTVRPRVLLRTPFSGASPRMPLPTPPTLMPSTLAQQVPAGRSNPISRETYDQSLLGITGTPPPKQRKKRATKSCKLGDANYSQTPQELRGTVLIAGREWPLPRLNIATGLMEVVGIPPTAIGYDRVTPASGWGSPINDPRNGQPIKAHYYDLLSARLFPVYTSDYCHWCILFGVQSLQDRYGGLCARCKDKRGES
jgi:hypothetical protein